MPYVAKDMIATGIADMLARVFAGAPDDLLDLYDRQRRHVANAFLQVMTIQNKRVLEEKIRSSAGSVWTKCGRSPPIHQRHAAF